MAAILLADVLEAYPFLLLPDEWFLMNQAYFLMNVSASPRSVSGSGMPAVRAGGLNRCECQSRRVATVVFFNRLKRNALDATSSHFFMHTFVVYKYNSKALRMVGLVG